MTAELSTTYEMVTHFQELAEHDKTVLARELHDELGGWLIGAVMDLAMLTPQISGLQPPLEDRLQRIRQALAAAIEITRRITEELHPTLLDNVGLFAALRWQVKNACLRTNIRCVDSFPDTEPLIGPGVSIALFRIVQEALIIGVERREVTALELSANVAGGVLSLRMSGNGATMSDDAGDLTKLILESIRHRVRALGGTVAVVSPPEGGIVLAVTTPIRSDSTGGFREASGRMPSLQGEIPAPQP